MEAYKIFKFFLFLTTWREKTNKHTNKQKTLILSSNAKLVWRNKFKHVFLELWYEVASDIFRRSKVCLFLSAINNNIQVDEHSPGDCG